MTNYKFPTQHLAKLTGHDGPVHALAYSAGAAQYILTGSTDRKIRLFNPARATADSNSTGLVQTYTGHGYDVADISVTADNAFFASVGGDKLVFVWDVATARTVRRFEGHTGRVNAVTFGGEGDSVVISGSYDATVRLWDVKSKAYKPIMMFSEGRDSISSLAVVGAEVFVGGIDGRVRVYDVRMGSVHVDVIAHSVTSLTPTKQSDSFLLSTLNSTLLLMDKANGKLLQSYRAPEYINTEYRIRSTLGMNDSTVLSGSEDGHIFVWDLVDGVVLHKLRHSKETGSAKKDVVSAVAFCPSGRKEWCSAGGDGQVVVWGMEDLG